MNTDLLLTVLLAALIWGFGSEFGKLVFRILTAFLVRPVNTPKWPWTNIH